jgi:hypothetical protein
MLGLIRCLLFPHMPNRRKVKKLLSGEYIGYCHHCDARIRRLKRDRWVRDWKRSFGMGGSEEAEGAASLDDDF